MASDLVPPPEAMGGLAQALAHADALMARSPPLAAEQARAILESVPGHPQARLLLGRALRLDGRPQAARSVLESLAQDQPRSAETRDELGRTALALGDEAAALGAWREAVRLAPDRASAWRALAELHAAREEEALASEASAQALRAASRDPELLQAGLALCDGRLAVAEHALRARLKRDPDDTAALRMLAETAARLGRHADAVPLLEHVLAIDPAFDAARATWPRCCSAPTVPPKR